MALYPTFRVVIVLVLLSCLGVAGGCLLDGGRMSGVVSADQVAKGVTGPMVFRRAVNSVEIFGTLGGSNEVRRTLRGVRRTGDASADVACELRFRQWIRPGDELYLLQEADGRGGAEPVILLKPATQSGIIDVATGRITREIRSYAVVQIWLLEFGEVLVDRTDTTHSMFKAFCRAEAQARREKFGYWATRSE